MSVTTSHITASDVPDLIKPGMTVFVQGSIGQPLRLMKALQEASASLGGIHYISPLTPGINKFPISPGTQESRLTTFFDYPDLRQSYQAGPIEFVPAHYSRIIPFLEQKVTIDIGLIQVSAPDAQGYCSTGISEDFVSEILPQCHTVIAEINHSMPPVVDGPRIPLGAFHYVVETDYPLPQIPSPDSNAVLDRIAANVLPLVHDGDTVQYGIGRVPQCIVSGLSEHNDLGLHSGLITPAVRSLIDKGVMTGVRKTIDTGRHVTGVAAGDQDFYDWISSRPDFSFRSVRHTHNPDTLARLDKLVAINSALEIDLFGQANAEMIGGRQISGSGGLVDFVRGARLSRNGRAVICLQSTSRNGQRSNIVLNLSGPVTICRTDMQYVVTEHGVADLAHKSIDERAHSLIAIAAPKFREQLSEDWKAGRKP
ncbi:acetyl-CoA hydrolase/transferase family protein [Emcibacter sp.]|uniref:acetyl-CoA hydrolase/transferase family protein n=1 Tax=Emcibacter sp. TaxID=1979954 RepID=UPI003A8DCB37